jgi:hypothetical protein
LNVACSGWDIHPWNVQFDKARIIVTAKLNRNPVQKKGYCNSLVGEKFLLNPYKYRQNDLVRREADWMMKHRVHKNFIHYYSLIGSDGWIADQYTSPKHMMSALFNQVSNYHELKKFCADVHPDKDVSKCAIVYGWLRKYHEYDEIAKHRSADYQTPEWVTKIEFLEEKKEMNEFDKYIDKKDESSRKTEL